VAETSTSVAAILHDYADPAGRACDHDLLQRTLEAMSPGQRIALLLHCELGFTAREVAEITVASPAAAQRQITRAKKTFRPALAGGPTSRPARLSRHLTKA
jgi:DNA-directed RNA polymerase specialized sigma24 family protein